MMGKGLLTAEISLIFFFLLHQTSDAQECDVLPSQQGFVFPRTFYVSYTGPATDGPLTKERMKKAFGSCGDLDDFAQKAVRYLDRYDVDLSAAKSDPYKAIDDPRFAFGVGVSPNRNYRIVYETFYNYAKYRDTPLFWVSWLLSAKANVQGPDGILPAGHHDAYAMYRFRSNGRDFCVLLKMRKPVVDFSHSHGPFDVLLYNKYFGEGAARGMFTLNNGTYDLHYVMRFPGDP